MNKKQKKKLMKFLISLLVMIVVTVVGYFKSEIEENINDKILAKPRSTRSSII